MTQPDLTIIVPAYNESLRIEPTLKAMVEYFGQRNISFQIIVVDDGSTDNTQEVVNQLSVISPQIEILALPRNMGKGFAVKSGMLAGKGKSILFADADGATPIAEYQRLEKALAAGADVVIGSRAKPSKETQVITRTDRKFIGRMFNFFVNLIIIPDIFDTQCGFKLFTSNAASLIFSRQTLPGFSFDVELLYIARRLNLNIQEVAINWYNVPGSKVNVVLDGLKMLRDIFVVRVRHSNLR